VLVTGGGGGALDGLAATLMNSLRNGSFTGNGQGSARKEDDREGEAPAIAAAPEAPAG
jgi:hypothetical protein